MPRQQHGAVTRFLFIFIDGFPFQILENAEFLSRAFSVALPLTPGLGYSVNIHAEMFRGATPDDLGYFNEWTYHPSTTTTSLIRWLSPLFDERGRLPLAVLDRGAHKVLARLGLAEANIPFPYQHLFSRKEKLSISQGERFMQETAFAELGRNTSYCISEAVRKAPGLRDVVAFERAMQALRKGNSVFVSFVDLDTISHAHGVGSEEYWDRVKLLDRWVCDLYDAFTASGATAERVFVFSDHGMANVNRGVSVTPEEALGPVSPHSYGYFTDATMMRVWIRDKGLQARVENYLGSLTGGRLVEDWERRACGITSPQFGDYVFVLDEGLVFEPSFVNRGGLPAAMHGYHPDWESQKGIFLSNFSSARLSAGRGLRAIEIFGVLEEAIQSR